MTSNKIKQKDLKRLDHFQVIGFRFLNWLLSSKTPLTAAALIVILTIVAFASWSIWTSKTLENRRNELAGIEKLYGDEAGKIEEKAEALRQELQTLEKLKELNPADKKAIDAGTKDPIADRRQAIEAEINSMKADHSESLAKFRAYHEKNLNYREGSLAGMRAVSILLERGEKADAEKILLSIVAKSKDDVFYQYQTRMSLIGLWLDAARYDEAIKAADEMIALTKDDKALKAQALLVKGNVMVSKGDKAAALGVYDLLIQDFPDSREAKRAQSLKAIL